MGGLLVERIEGDYNNVVGFPGQVRPPDLSLILASGIAERSTRCRLSSDGSVRWPRKGRSSRTTESLTQGRGPCKSALGAVNSCIVATTDGLQREGSSTGSLLGFRLLPALRTNSELRIRHPFLWEDDSSMTFLTISMSATERALMIGLSWVPRSVQRKDFSRMMVGEACSGF